MAITNTSKSKEFVAGSSPIILKGDYRPKENMKMASPDYIVRRMEDLLALGYDYDTAGKLAMDEFAYREAMEKGEVNDRQEFGLGSLVKSIGKAVKGVVKGVKDNPLLAAAAINFAPMLTGGSPLIGLPAGVTNFFTSGSKAAQALKVGGAGSVITGLLASMEQEPGESNEDFANRQAQVRDQLNVQFRRLYPKGGNESDEEYDIRIGALVEGADDSTIPVGEMAEGGRVNRAMGDSASDNAVQAAGIEGLPLRENSKGVKEVDLRETGGFIPPVGIKEKADDIPAMLSNNEFVFTADAVRAAGGGSVNRGAQRMYDLMKNLESKVG